MSGRLPEAPWRSGGVETKGEDANLPEATPSDGTHSSAPQGGGGAAAPGLAAAGPVEETIGGTEVTWSYDPDTRTLTLGGSGSTPDYTDKDKQPWKDHNSDIEKIVIGDGITGLGDRAFYPSPKLTEVEWSGNSALTRIGEGVFRGCTALETIEIPESVEELGRAQFYGDKALKSVVLRGNYSLLNEITFGGCKALESIEIPASVKELAGSENKAVFYNCAVPSEITYGGTIADWKHLLSTDASGNLLHSEITVTCQDGEYHYTEGDENASGPAVDGENSGTFPDSQATWSYDPDTRTLTLGGSGSTPDYTKKDKQPWKDYNSDIEKIVIGDGITGLGDRAFYPSPKLTEVEWPEAGALTRIGEGVFRGCTALETIEIPESVEELGRAQFYEDTALKNVVLKGSYSLLDEITFGKCTALESVVIPASVKELAGSGNKAVFYNCTVLSEITYGGTIEEWKALIDRDTKASAALQKDSITVFCSDGKYVYGLMETGDVSYKLDGTVLTFYGSGAIPDYPEGSAAPWAADADKVTTVVIPAGITKIGDNAFAGFTALEEVYYIGYADGWENLKETAGASNDLLFDSKMILGTEGSCGDNVVWNLDLETHTLTISGSGPMANWQSDSGQTWKYSTGEIENLVVEDGVTTLGDYAFSRCKKLKEVDLSGSVEIIGVFTFRDCVGLTSLRLPEGMRVIGSKTFQNCSGIQKLELPVSLKYIDMKAFEGNSSLETVIYSGTKVQWEQIQISRQAKGNEMLLNAQLVCAEPEPVSERYTDVEPGSWYTDSLQYLTDYGWLDVESEIFSGDEAVSEDLVLDILYRRDGAPGVYESAEEWADQTGITDGNAGGGMTLAELAEILYRTARYNGTDMAEKPEGGAVDWCRRNGFLQILENAGAEPSEGGMLTRAQASAVLAAYMKDPASSADHYEEMTAKVRTALEQGGDGNLYILTPKKFESEEKDPLKCGDCTVIIFPRGSTMMIDGGSEFCSEPIIRLLEDIGLKDLDYIVLSHPHSDHVGGIRKIAPVVHEKGGNIGKYYAVDFDFDVSEDTETMLHNYGAEIHKDVEIPYDFPDIDGVTIDIYNPSHEMIQAINAKDKPGETDINNISILMKLNYGESTYLTGGDLYAAKERELAGEYSGQLQADAMKTNHHGTYTSSCDEWLDTVDPKIAVSDADDNGSQVLAEKLQSRGVAYYSEGLDGLIMITMDDAKNYRVDTQFASGLRIDYEREPDSEIDEPEGPDEPKQPVQPDRDDHADDDDDDDEEPTPNAAVKEQVTSEGNWEFGSEGWRFRRTDGTYPSGQWERLLYNGQVYWYYFDEKGCMRTGWVDWNGFRFYLNPVSDGWCGKMLTGWVEIEGKWYYFEPVSGQMQGHLYVDTVTPDGYRVIADGSWDGQSR